MYAEEARKHQARVLIGRFGRLAVEPHVAAGAWLQRNTARGVAGDERDVLTCAKSVVVQCCTHR
jgi:hypothetical protein